MNYYIFSYIEKYGYCNYIGSKHFIIVKTSVSPKLISRFRFTELPVPILLWEF